MINIILASAVFDILGPPPGYFKETPVVETVAKEEIVTPRAVEEKKEESVSNNDKPKTVKKTVKQESPAKFRKTISKIIDAVQAEPSELIIKQEPITTALDYNVSEDGDACSKVETVEENFEPVKEEIKEIFEDPKEEPEEEIHYYVYTGVNCRYCTLLLAELESNVNVENISVVENARKTKSGKIINYYPVLEVYKDEELIYHGVGYRKWNDLAKVINKK